MNSHYYHLFANGANSREFIVSEEDFVAAINRFAVCAANTDVETLAFSIEESHPHALLRGSPAGCVKFKCIYEYQTKRYITAARGGLVGVVFECDMLEVTDVNYLRSVGGYIVSQPTKDGKGIMPYDYRWGTGSMYFRSAQHVDIWRFDEHGNICDTVQFGELTIRMKKRLTHSKHLSVPDSWQVCNGIILPSNYVAVDRFEAIYRTCNCFRVFLSSSKAKDKEIIDKIALQSGITLSDVEARRLCTETCRSLFGKDTSRWLDTRQRAVLARELRKKFRMTFRQISDLTRIPEPELRDWII